MYVWAREREGEGARERERERKACKRSSVGTMCTQQINLPARNYERVEKNRNFVERMELYSKSRGTIKFASD